MFFTYIVFGFKVVCIPGYMNVCKILLLCTATTNMGLYFTKLKPLFDVPFMHNFTWFEYCSSDLSARQRKHYLSSYSFLIKKRSR